MGGAVAERQPGRAAADRYAEAAERDVAVVDPLVGVAGQEHVVRARARPWRAAASSARGSGPGPRPPRRAGSGTCPRRRWPRSMRAASRGDLAERPQVLLGSRLVNCSTSCQTSARCTRLRVLPRPARRARKYSSRELSAWPRTTCDHSSCRKRASQPVLAELEAASPPTASTALESSIQCRRVPGSASVTTFEARASMLTTSTRSRMSRPASSSSRDLQVGGEVLVERGEQDVLAVTAAGSRSTRCLTRCRATIVLPVPGPPLTRAGPL